MSTSFGFRLGAGLRKSGLTRERLAYALPGIAGAAITWLILDREPIWIRTLVAPLGGVVLEGGAMLLALGAVFVVTSVAGHEDERKAFISARLLLPSVALLLILAMAWNLYSTNQRDERLRNCMHDQTNWLFLGRDVTPAAVFDLCIDADRDGARRNEGRD